LFKKRAKEILKTEAGKSTGVRNFCQEDGRKRMKLLDEIFKINSLKDQALKGRVYDQFRSTLKELDKKQITEVEPTRKISSLKVDTKILNMLDEVVRDFVQTQPPKNMTDIAKILQSVQIAYQAITTKVKTKSEWLNNINEKICDLEKKKSLLMKYKEENTSLKGEELKEARRIM
jgi:hypothetical protein